MNTSEQYLNIQPRYPEFRGQVAIVSGSSRGIGKGIALRLAREGMRLVIHGHLAAEVDATVAELRVLGADVTGLALDFRDDSAAGALVDAALHSYGGLNLLVNNAADLKVERTADVDRYLLDRQFSINLRTPFLLCQRAADVMQASGGGNIVNIGSIGGQRAHRPGLPYDITKGGVEAMTRALALDLAPYGIRVNAVAPGPIITERTMAANFDAVSVVAGRVPLNRLGGTTEIGAAVAFLASADAAFITGQVLNVDGGVTAQLSPPGLWI